MVVQSLVLAALVPFVTSFEFPKLPNIFGGAKIGIPSPAVLKISQQKSALLEAVSFTNNGKSATAEKQREVLGIVGAVEASEPVGDDLFTNNEKLKLLDGIWYLQYTSPSKIGDQDDIPNTWEPSFASEGESNIETRQFNAKGSVSAVGINVDTSNRVVKQIIDTEGSTVTNDITLDFGRVVVGGPFRPSPNVPNRAIVSFEKADITLNNGFVVKLGFVFALLATIRGSKDNGWLETTFLDEDIRIGRGNKGTMFVLTRDVEAVKP